MIFLCAPRDIPLNECVHSITAHWNARDMIDNKKIDSNSSGFELIYAAGNIVMLLHV